MLNREVGCPIQRPLLSLSGDFLPDLQISTLRKDPLNLRLNGAPVASVGTGDGEPETFSPNQLLVEEGIDTRKTRVPHLSPSVGLEWETSIRWSKTYPGHPYSFS